MSLVSDLKLTPQERLQKELKDVNIALQKFVACKSRIYLIATQIEDESDKDKRKRLKGELRLERKNLRKLLKNFKIQAYELAYAQYVVDNLLVEGDESNE